MTVMLQVNLFCNCTFFFQIAWTDPPPRNRKPDPHVCGLVGPTRQDEMGARQSFPCGHLAFHSLVESHRNPHWNLRQICFMDSTCCVRYVLWSVCAASMACSEFIACILCALHGSYCVYSRHWTFTLCSVILCTACIGSLVWAVPSSGLQASNTIRWHFSPQPSFGDILSH